MTDRKLPCMYLRKEVGEKKKKPYPSAFQQMHQLYVGKMKGIYHAHTLF